MAYAIMRLQKVSGGLKNLSRIRSHHLPLKRGYIQNREHEEREKFNKFYEKDGKTLHELGKELLQQHKEITGRKARSDSVIFFEVLTTVSPELESDVLKNFNEWFKKNKEWLKEEFPSCQICQASAEFDESTPHIHFYLAATDENGKLNARKIVGNRKDYERRQATYEDKMRELFPNLEKRKSKKVTKKKHKSVREFWKEEDERLQKEHESKMNEFKKIEDNERKRITEEVFSDKKVTKKSFERLSQADDILL